MSAAHDSLSADAGATVADRILDRDAALFVGRDRELERIDRVLAGGTHNVVYLHGDGGIGKSALLREIARRAERSGFETSWLDGRDLPPFPAVVESRLAELPPDRKWLVLFDSYENISSLDTHLRDHVIPTLPASTVVVFASRQRPATGWFSDGWDAVVESMELDGLSPDDLRQLAHAHGLPDDHVERAIVRSHGSPLAVVVAAHAGVDGSIPLLVDRLIGDEVDPDHARVLSVAAIARVTTPELLDAAVPGLDGSACFEWLATRTFTEPLADGVALHALVADAVRERLRIVDPAGEAALRRRIADHLYARAVAGEGSLSADLQHLVVDPNVRWGFSADIGVRYRVDQVRDGDAEQVGAILDAIGQAEWWAVTSVFFRDHPDYVGVARDREGRVGGYYVAVSPANAPAAAESDVLLGPWLRHARRVLRTNSAVLWREAVDLTGEFGEVTALLGAAAILGTGVINPRYGFLPIADEVPAARLFSEALGAQHLPELDLDAHGMQLACHVVDFGPTGLLGFQRDWIYRESGALPPIDDAEADPARVLRMLRDPNALGLGPDWLGATPSDRLERLRAMVSDAIDGAFGDHRDDQLAAEILRAAYLGDGASHETIARRFHLSRSAYFRRLQAATTRLSAELGTRIHAQMGPHRD